MASNQFAVKPAWCAIILVSVFIHGVFPIAAKADESSCVVCHTDAEMLLDNLAPAAQKKSALQAGAG